jgi:hypothetical protein
MYMPEARTKGFDTNDVIIALQRTIAKYGKTTKDGKPRFKSTDGGKADSTIALASTMIAELKTVITNDLGGVFEYQGGRLQMPSDSGNAKWTAEDVKRGNDDLGAGRVRTPTFDKTEVPEDTEEGNETIKLPAPSHNIPVVEKATAEAS